MMKQGTGQTTMSATKREPISRGIDPGYVSQIGIIANERPPEQMYQGRGIEAQKPLTLSTPAAAKENDDGQVQKQV